MATKIFDLIEEEKRRQIEGLEMIPSENFASANVLKAVGSVLTNKYSEGYPGARYYSGNKIIDEIERYTQDLANNLFHTVHANVQPYSGSPANLAVSLSLAGVGGIVMGLDLSAGGHLTHGAKASATSSIFTSISYHVDESGRVDFEELEQLATEHKPQIIWVGGTAYVYTLEFEKFAAIADKVGAYLVADVSHIVGLIAGGVHPDPSPFVDVITTTTHKTLRGPRGAMILVTKKGIEKDHDLPSKIDKAVFPGLQGGPHDNQVAALAIALEEASTDEFKAYATQIVNNASTLAAKLKGDGLKLVGDTTENHLMLLDLQTIGYGLGYQAHIALEAANIFVNKNAIPKEPASPFYPSGIRLGTPALTSRGMKEEEMKKIAVWIKKVLDEIKGYDLPENQSDRAGFIKEFRKKIDENTTIMNIKDEVTDFSLNYPIPGV